MRLFVLVLLFLFSCSHRTPLDTELEGGKRLKDFVRRDYLLVYVWSGSCLGHFNDLKTLSGKYPSLENKGYSIISVALFMKGEEALEILKDKGINPPFPVVGDPKGNLAQEVKMIFLPATLIFSKEGVLIENHPRLPDL